MGCDTSNQAIPWNELIGEEQKGLREMLFPGIAGGLQQGPQSPQFPVNAPWDQNFGAGMNMFRGLGDLPQNYTPQQMPIFFDPSWNPTWPGFGDYSASPRVPVDPNKPPHEWGTEEDPIETITKPKNRRKKVD